MIFWILINLINRSVDKIWFISLLHLAIRFVRCSDASLVNNQRQNKHFTDTLCMLLYEVFFSFFFLKDLSKLESCCLCEKVCEKRRLVTHNSFLSCISLHFFHLKKKKEMDMTATATQTPTKAGNDFPIQQRSKEAKSSENLSNTCNTKRINKPPPPKKRAAEPSLPIALLVSCGNAQMTTTTWRLAAADEKRHNRVTAAIDLQSAWRRPHPATHTHRVWTEWQCRGRVRGIHYSAAGLFLATPQWLRNYLLRGW